MFRTEDGLTAVFESDEKRWRAVKLGYRRERVLQMLVGGVICYLAGCTQANPPLSIALKNPKSGAVQKCSAREGSGKDTPALSQAVEMCARRLEARGYVRVPEEQPK